MKFEKIIPAFTDDRGTIIDVLAGELIDYVTVINTVAGAVRGNHYHEETFQWIYMLSGRMRVRTQIRGETPKDTILDQGDLILNEPLEGHAFQALKNSSFLVLTRGPRGGNDFEQDTYRLEVSLIDPKL